MQRRLTFLIIPMFVLSLLSSPRPVLAANSIWVGSTADLAVFIQWTEHQGQLSGQLQAAWLTATSGYSAKWDTWASMLKVESITRPFAGVRSGPNVTITHSGGNWTGTIVRTNLQLIIPRQSGSLWKLVLTPGSVEEYNSAVSSLYAAAVAVNERNAVIAAVRARWQDLAQTVDALSGNVGAVRRASDFSDTLARYPEILRRMEELEAEIRAKAAVQSLTCSELGRIQVRLGSMEVAMGSVEVANGSFDIARARLRRAISGTEATMARAVALLASLKRAVAADSTRTVTVGQLAEVERSIRATLNWAATELPSAKARLVEAEQEVSDYNARARYLLDGVTVFVKSLMCTD